MTVYNAKNLEEWRKIINNAMPQGILWNGIDNKNTNIYKFLSCIAEVFRQRDANFAERFNSLKLDENSQFLDEYWDMFGISKYIKEKPENNVKKYKIINAFAKASSGISTSQQIEDFINEIFDLDISIYISDIKTSKYNNRFICKFPFKFASFNVTDNTVVVRLPTANEINDENVLTTKKIPFALINRDNFTDTIKMLLDLIIDIDLKIVYI